MIDFNKRWINAPTEYRTEVNGVMIYPDEDVVWLYSETSEGKYISGYNIIKKD